MGHYTVKPPRIEAFRVPNHQVVTYPWVVIKEWCDGEILIEGDRPYGIRVSSAGREFTVTPGDWVIEQANGCFYPCDDLTFRQVYEEM